MEKKHKIFLIVAISTLLFTLLLPAYNFAQTYTARDVNYDYHFNRGVYHYNLREYSSAVINFQQAAQLRPSENDARRWLGKAYYYTGFLTNAITEWQRIIENGGDPLLADQINGILYGLNLPTLMDRRQNYIPFGRFDFSSSVSRMKPTSILFSGDKFLVTGFLSSQVYVIDPNGRIIDRISRADESFVSPYDIRQDADDNFYITDYGRDAVIKLSSDMDFIQTIGSTGSNPGQFYGPMGMDISRDNEIFVVDSGNHRIQKITANGHVVGIFGSRGSDAGQLLNPTDVVCRENLVFVADYDNSRIAVFDVDGNFLYNLTAEKISAPRGIRFIDEERLLVCDDINGVFTYSIVNGLCDELLIEDDDVEISFPMDGLVDDNNILYITDFGSSMVSLFCPENTRSVNLQVTIEQTYNGNYPFVSHKVKVRDRYNNAINGLSNENFTVYDEGISIAPLTVTSLNEFNEDVSLILINDKTSSMQIFEELRNTIARRIAESLRNQDKIKVFNYNDHVWAPGNYVRGPLNLQAHLNSGEYKDGSKLSLALHQSISEAHRQNTRRAVVVLLSQNPTIDDFNPYGLQEIISFAKVNDVPIHIVTFFQEHNEIVDSLTQLTGGTVYYAQTSNEVYDLVETVREQSFSTYLVSYDVPDRYTFLSTTGYRNVSIHASYRNLFGSDVSGYLEYINYFD